MRPALEEGDGAVDGIDDEQRAVVEPLAVIDAFLRQPAIAGPRLGQGAAQIGIDFQIGFGDGTAALLAPALAAFLETPPRNLTAGAAGGFQKVEIVGSGQGQAPAMVIPSIRTVGALVPWRNSRSLAGVSLANISIRLPAMVTSETG